MNLRILVLLSLVPTLAHAQEDKLKLSVLAFNLAIDKARKDSDACKQAVMTPLKDARDSIQTAADAATLTKARRAVEDLADGGGAQCGEPVKKEMQRALDRLSEAIAERAPPAPAPAPAGGGGRASSSIHPDLEAAKKCWNYTNPWTHIDPGCAFTREGKPPWSKQQFEKLRGTINNAGDRFARTAAVEKAVGETKVYLTCLQVSTLLGLFPEETDRAETVKRFAPTLVDSHNAGILGRHFRDGQARKDVLQTVDEHKENK